MNLRLASLAAAAACLMSAGAATADTFTPNGTVSIVTHSGPGSGPDVLARMLISVIEKEKLTPVRFQVVNKTGGGSTAAMNYLKEKAGDNLTLGLFATSWTSDPLVQKAATTSLQDLTPVANLIIEPALVVVSADSPFKSVSEFIVAAKAEPNKYKASGGSPLGRDALVRYVLMANTGAKYSYISFQTEGERTAALLGHHTDIYVVDATEAADLVTSGTLRALAQMNETRLSQFPNLPTIKEAGFDYLYPVQARGLVGPPGMSKDAVAYYQNLFERVVNTPTWKAYLEQRQLASAFMSSEQLGTFLKDNANNIRELLKGAGIAVVR